MCDNELDGHDAGHRQDQRKSRWKYSYPAIVEEEDGRSPELPTFSPSSRAASEVSVGPSASQIASSFVSLPDDCARAPGEEEYETLQADLDDLDDCVQQLDFEDMSPLRYQGCSVEARLLERPATLATRSGTSGPITPSVRCRRRRSLGHRAHPRSVDDRPLRDRHLVASSAVLDSLPCSS